MRTEQDDLDMIERHIALAEQHIVEQERRISVLELHYHPTADAIKFLDVLNEFLRLHRQHSQKIEDRAAHRAFMDDRCARALQPLETLLISDHSREGA